MDKLRNFIRQVLDIIEFEGNREKFVDDMIKAINLKAAHSLVESLSPEDQENVKEVAQTTEDFGGYLGKLLKNKLGSSKVDSTLKTLTQEVLVGYFKEISPSLSDEKKSKLKEYINTFDLRT